VGLLSLISIVPATVRMSFSLAKVVAASLPALAWYSWAGSTVTALPVVVLASPVLFFLVFFRDEGILSIWASQTKRPKSQSVSKNRGTGAEEAHNCSACPGYTDPLRWSFLPSSGGSGSGVLRANLPYVHEFENDFLNGKGLALHQPTHAKHLEATGEYPYSWHLSGRKRLWEIRLQIRFKRIPQSKVYFGLELGGYVPVSGFAKRVQQALVKMIRAAVGNDFYHSSGDNPAEFVGECEPPTFVMPLWAFDQFVVSEIGEEPDITGDLSNVGVRRTDGVQAYVKAMSETVASLSMDKVYTFSFWGISQLLDCMAWEVNIWGLRLDFNRLCGAAPVFVGMYELSEPQAVNGKPEQRHLLSRKQYLLHVAMWSEQKPPSPQVLSAIVGSEAAHDTEQDVPKTEGLPSSIAKALGCCVGRGDACASVHAQKQRP